MATKKKSKKPARATKPVRKSVKPTKSVAKKKSAAKKPAAKKPVTKKKVATKAPVRAKPTAKAKVAPVAKKKRPQRAESSRPAFSREERDPRSGQLAGDLQGLSDSEGADSESVDELLEEGNAFEAGIVGGVEEGGDRGVEEVHTREVPEDDVPEEYLEKDQ
jgi:hypothetical protein